MANPAPKKPVDINAKRESELITEWLDLDSIENKKGQLAKELFALRGNKPFTRGGVTMRVLERIDYVKDESGRVTKDESGKSLEKSRTYLIRRLTEETPEER